MKCMKKNEKKNSTAVKISTRGAAASAIFFHLCPYVKTGSDYQRMDSVSDYLSKKELCVWLPSKERSVCLIHYQRNDYMSDYLP